MVTTQTPAASVGQSPVMERGFILDTEAAAYGFRRFSAGYPHFWGSVIAGTLVAMAIGVLSEALMFACHVGVTQDGAVDMHGGSAAWLIITACIAYFIGGAVAGSVGHRRDPQSWLRGVTLWGLSIPLAIVMGSALAGSAGIMYAHMGPMASQMASSSAGAQGDQGPMLINFSAAWTSFFTLLAALIFAILGSMPRGRGETVLPNHDMDPLPPQS
jgi:hypothetical protein